MKKFFTKVQPMEPGMYHKQSAPEEPTPYRIHLRLQPDGSGVLVVNAATVLHLNPTAAEYAYHLIKGSTPAAAAKEIASRYRINKKTALQDYNDFAVRIQRLVTATDLDPESYLDFERVSPHSMDLSAPLRLDCALTYRLPAGTQADYAPTKRVDRELTTDEWCSVLVEAWQFGIPHVTFTGGEATLRDDLVDLIVCAEKNGQVCGLLTDGLKLADKNYLELLLKSGLDHILLLLQPDRNDSWKALETIMPEDIFVTVHFTLTPQNASNAKETLSRLSKLGVKSLSLSASDESLHETMRTLHNSAAALGLTLRWDLPVPYSAENPVAHQALEDEIPVGAGKTWLYVEPDGDVLPTQGMADHILGNVLRDPWERLYQK